MKETPNELSVSLKTSFNLVKIWRVRSFDLNKWNSVHVMKVFNSRDLVYSSARRNLARACYHSSDFDSKLSTLSYNT